MVQVMLADVSTSGTTASVSSLSGVILDSSDDRQGGGAESLSPPSLRDEVSSGRCKYAAVTGQTYNNLYVGYQKLCPTIYTSGIQLCARMKIICLLKAVALHVAGSFTSLCRLDFKTEGQLL
jgi:hypothetical protein